MTKNKYQVLGFKSKNVSLNSIKKHYKILAKIYHPDNQTTGNAKMFLVIKNAYDSFIKQIPFDEKATQNLHFDYGNLFNDETISDIFIEDEDLDFVITNPSKTLFEK